MNAPGTNPTAAHSELTATVAPNPGRDSDIPRNHNVPSTPVVTAPMMPPSSQYVRGMAIRTIDGDAVERRRVGNARSEEVA